VAVLGLNFFNFHIPLAGFTIMSKTGEKPMKAGPSHPTYLQMILDAITEIGNPKGSSRQAITKHVLAKYPDLDGEKKRVYLRRAISAGLESEVLELGKNKGNKGCGSFKIADCATGDGKLKRKDHYKRAVEGKKVVPKRKVSNSGDEKLAKKQGVKKRAERKGVKSLASKTAADKKVVKGSAAEKAVKGSQAKTIGAKRVTKSPVGKKTAKK